jgi:hypothetical protein
MLTKTTNGENAHGDLVNKNVELFYGIGSARHNQEGITASFKEALTENADVASAVLAWARDARNGAGERLTYRTLLKELIVQDKAKAEKLVKLTPTLGRFDDLRSAFGTELQEDAVQTWIAELHKGNELAYKWVNIKKDKELRIAMGFGDNRKAFRKHIVKGRPNIVENKMSSQKWDTIEYPKVPSKAMNRYGKAFKNHDANRFDAWVNQPTSKVNASVLYPYDVYKVRELQDPALLRKQWDAIPLEASANILPIVDTSSSMNSPAGCGLSCKDMAVSLGTFIAMRNKGSFVNKFMSFNEEPRVHVIDPNDTLPTIFNKVLHADWGGCTNFHKSYLLLLDMAIMNKTPQADMPKYILVLSDMQFNESQGHSSFNYNQQVSKLDTGFEKMAQAFKLAGYDMPKIIFWNLSKTDNFPTASDEEGVAMVSGFSPKILTSILKDQLSTITPESVMMDTIKPYQDMLSKVL